MAAAERTKWTAAEKEEEKAIMTEAKQQEDEHSRQLGPQSKTFPKWEKKDNDRRMTGWW